MFIESITVVTVIRYMCVPYIKYTSMCVFFLSGLLLYCAHLSYFFFIFSNFTTGLTTDLYNVMYVYLYIHSRIYTCTLTQNDSKIMIEMYNEAELDLSFQIKFFLIRCTKNPKTR